jgi:TPP-dependent pyruvate/acetoin dehydrogenase alpha subunit
MFFLMEKLDLFRDILKVRLFEEKLDYLFKRGLVNGTAHFCIGQEFVPVVISGYLNDKDTVTSTHRGHGHALAKGLSQKRLLAEIIGKEFGYNCGVGGSQHVISRRRNFIANGITGGMVPVSNGIAFAEKYNGSSNVVVSYLGDGGFNEGYVQETLNLAKVLGLPVLFICENNQYAMSTAVKRAHSADIVLRAKSFGIESAVVEDNDYVSLDKYAKDYVSRMREGEGPFFLEVRTYRHFGHSKNDQNLYRDKKEEDYWFERDVLELLRKDMLKKGEASEGDLDDIEIKMRKEIDDIADEVVKMPTLDCESVSSGVFSE